MDPDITSDVADYYSDTLRKHGQTAKGVDWNGPDSQNLRFTQLLRIVPDDAPYDIVDFGCGYGALYDVVTKLRPKINYHGIDASQDMVRAARQRYNQHSHAFTVATKLREPTDFVVASGLFNVKMGRNTDVWESYFLDTLANLCEHARCGVAFNCLTSYSDPSKMRDDLYYCDPLWLFDLCKRKFSARVALLHDYELYEFTMMIRMQP